MPSIADYFNGIASRTGFSSTAITSLVGGAPSLPRLQLLAEVVDAVAGSYTQEGVRMWFARARRPLEGKSPKEVLQQPNWQPSDAGPQEVLRMARSLLS